MKPGIGADGVAQTDLDHFGNGAVRGALVVMRNLARVLAHAHDADTEINEGAEPLRHGRLQRRC
jgi:hypothetical protein